MKTICKKCDTKLGDLQQNEAHKLEVWGLVMQDLNNFAVQKILDNYGFTSQEARIIITHINTEYGKCVSCDNTELTTESSECPKCGAFNYNIKAPAFNKEFCDFLEYHHVFYGCDGVDCFPYDLKSLSVENILKNKSIRTRAKLGGGQEIYELTIKFGRKSIDNYVKGLSLIDCIPDSDSSEWSEFQPEINCAQITLL